jgi:hypothetical protein
MAKTVQRKITDFVQPLNRCFIGSVAPVLYHLTLQSPGFPSQLRKTLLFPSRPSKGQALALPSAKWTKAPATARQLQSRALL